MFFIIVPSLHPYSNAMWLRSKEKSVFIVLFGAVSDLLTDGGNIMAPDFKTTV